MTQENSRRVLVGKIDLDTVGVAFIFSISRDDKVEALRGEAASEDLADNSVICIEVGGSGRVLDNNWDHHEAGGPEVSATYQAFCDQVTWFTNSADESVEQMMKNHRLPSLVKYINQLDTEGFRSLPGYGKVAFPTLSDVFAGMLLTERNPVEQLHKGVEILKSVMESEQDPFGTIEGFDAYAEAKTENNRQIAKALERAQWDTTFGGLKLAYLETDFFGAPGALYENGAQVVVAYSPHFGPAKVPKFTIGGNNVKVNGVLKELNALESGWGGPPTGTIVGSPREGSKLSFEVVVDIVKRVL